eukprot:Skav218330  [mRNA]  locus=scaffold755:20642:28181:+ [translate_table: standard]
MSKAGDAEHAPAVMTAAMGAVKGADDDTSGEFVSRALSEAQKANRRVHWRVRWPAFLVGAVFMVLSMFRLYTSWTAQAAGALLIRDVLRSLGCLSWLCAVLPSDRFGSKACHRSPQVGAVLLIVIGVKCLVWHTETMVNYWKLDAVQRWALVAAPFNSGGSVRSAALRLWFDIAGDFLG